MPGPIQSIQRAAAVLDLLERSQRPLTLKQLTDELALPKPTVHGLLRTLVDLEYVEQDEAGAAYVIGARHHGGEANIDGNVLRSAGMGWCDTLASIVEAEVWLAIIHDAHAVVVHHVFRPDDTPQRLRLGEEFPLHATAAGKLLLAYSVNRDRLLRNLIMERFTSVTTTSRQQLSADITHIRGSGLAAEVGEFEVDGASLAVPIHGRRRGAVAALAVHGPPPLLFGDGQRPRDAIVESMRAAAASITRELGER